MCFCSILAVAVAALLAPGIALADDGGATAVTPAPDLRVRQFPAPKPDTLMMRAATGPAAIAVPAAAAADVDAVDAVDDADASIDVGYRALPSNVRDLEERLIFKVNVGYGLDVGDVSGDVGKGGFAPEQVTDPNGNAFADQRQYLLGDAVLGTRGMLLPSMNTYFLSRFALEADGASQFAALNTVYDERDGRALLVRAAYAEIDDNEDDETLLGRVFLRAGRQFRYGANTFVTNFDGVSLGYDAPGFEVNGFFGQRVSLFFGDDPGLLGGAGFKLRGEDIFDVPLDIKVDYLFFDGGAPADENLIDEDLNLNRQYVELSARTKVAGWRIHLHTRLLDNGDLRDDDGDGEGDGFALGKLGIQVRKAFGQKFVFIADAEQKFAGEVAYDYINPAPNDILDIAASLGIGLDAPEDATRIRVRASYMATRALELYGFGRFNLVGDSTSGFNRSFQEVGAALSHRLGTRLWSSAQYKVRLTDLDDDANLAGGEFFDTSGSGVKQFHEISGETRYSIGYRKASAALGAYYRIYYLQSPYTTIDEDGRGGARVDADYWFTKYIRAKLAGELAEASAAIAPELGTLYSIRLLMEATF